MTAGGSERSRVRRGGARTPVLGHPSFLLEEIRRRGRKGLEIDPSNATRWAPAWRLDSYRVVRVKVLRDSLVLVATRNSVTLRAISKFQVESVAAMIPALENAKNEAERVECLRCIHQTFNASGDKDVGAKLVFIFTEGGRLRGVAEDGRLFRS